MLCNLYTSDIAAEGKYIRQGMKIPFSLYFYRHRGLDDEWLCDVHLNIILSDIRISFLHKQKGEGKLLEVNLKTCGDCR